MCWLLQLTVCAVFRRNRRPASAPAWRGRLPAGRGPAYGLSTSHHGWKDRSPWHTAHSAMPVLSFDGLPTRQGPLASGQRFSRARRSSSSRTRASAAWRASRSALRSTSAVARASLSDIRAACSLSNVAMCCLVAGSIHANSPCCQRRYRFSAALYPCRTPPASSSMATGS